MSNKQLVRPHQLKVSLGPETVVLTTYAKQARGARIIVGQVRLDRATWRADIKGLQVHPELGLDRGRRLGV